MQDATRRAQPAIRGRCLPGLLDEALEQNPNPQALNQPEGTGWRSLSTRDFATLAEDSALGLRARGLTPGDRVALFMESDLGFCTVDQACLLAGLVDVPLYLTNSVEANAFVLRHCGAVALCVSASAQLPEVLPLLREAPAVELVLVADEGDAPPEAPPGWPERARLKTLRSVQEEGRRERAARPGAPAALRAELSPDQLATIVYTSGTTGEPKGVELSHENVASNAIAAFEHVAGLRRGPVERALSFLPLSHAFGRTLLYGYLRQGTSIYFTTPAQVSAHLRSVRPTTFSSVPRVIERVWERIALKGAALSGWRRRLFDRSLRFAASFDPERPPRGLRALERRILDRLIYRRWRAALGGEVRLVVSGGAALRAEIVRAFLCADICLCQGYGLTEASPILTVNTVTRNRLGTVGLPLPETELRIAADGELLARGPQIMRGYHRAPEATAEVLDAEGWLHTGDIAEIDAEGFVKITDRKKDLFKLSTGKYVSPAPIEERLGADPLLEQAVVVGDSRKYCGALLFPKPDALRAHLRRQGEEAPESLEALLAEPKVQQRMQELVDVVNAHLPDWEQVKRFCLLSEPPSIENGLLTPTLKVRRRRVWDARLAEIDALYEASPNVRDERSAR